MFSKTPSFNPNPYHGSLTTAPAVADENQQSKHPDPPRMLPQNVERRRVWIDIDNSPHVPFFIPIIEELKKRGVAIDLTARDIYQVCELIQFFKLPCKIIGGHYGKNKVLKVLGNCFRASQLVPTAARFRASLALSHGSRAQVLACKALGIPTIVMHDYEYSTKTGFIEPDWVFMPDVIPDSAMSNRPERILKYPGLKEDVYVPGFVPDPSILSSLGISRDQIVVTLRPPATEAHYHNPESEQLFAEALHFLSENPRVRAVVLPRNQKQGAQLRREWASLIASGSMIIPTDPLDGLNLIWFSDLVISGGGTMNREATALGVPVYSVFRGKIGAVDRYLAEKGRLTLLESISDVRTKVVLVQRNRLSRPEKIDRPALRTIVDKIVMILDEKCPAAGGVVAWTRPSQLT
jgi:uncharacterized protein